MFSIPQQHAAEVVPATEHYTHNDCQEMLILVQSPRQHHGHEILLNLVTHVQQQISSTVIQRIKDTKVWPNKVSISGLV